MSKTVLTWLGIYGSALILTWVDPIYGLMGVMTEYYKRPGLQWWGNELPRLRFNLIVTAVFAASVFVRYSDLRELPKIPRPVIYWWAAFAINLWLVNLLIPIDPERAFEWAVYWSKVGILMPLLLVLVLRSRREIDLFILANVIGVLTWGWEAYTDPKRDQSRLMGIGSGDTLNDNQAAAHLLLILPFIAVMIVDKISKIRRAVALIALPLVVNTLILCNSRGAMLGFACALAAVPALARKGHRAKSLIAGFGVVVCFILLADPQFIERQQWFSTYEQDGSAEGRLEGWRQGGRILNDYPLGVGARGFHVLIPRYSAALNERHDGDERAPHNTSVQIATEYGVLGIFLGIMWFASIGLMLNRTRRLALTFNDNYFYYRIVAVMVALIGLLVAAQFSDRLYSEGVYWIIGIGLALYRLALSEQATALEAPKAPAIAA